MKFTYTHIYFENMKGVFSTIIDIIQSVWSSSLFRFRENYSITLRDRRNTHKHIKIYIRFVEMLLIAWKFTVIWLLSILHIWSKSSAKCETRKKIIIAYTCDVICVVVSLCFPNHKQKSRAFSVFFIYFIFVFDVDVEQSFFLKA